MHTKTYAYSRIYINYICIHLPLTSCLNKYVKRDLKKPADL